MFHFSPHNQHISDHRVFKILNSMQNYLPPKADSLKQFFCERDSASS